MINNFIIKKFLIVSYYVTGFLLLLSFSEPLANAIYLTFLDSGIDSSSKFYGFLIACVPLIAIYHYGFYLFLKYLLDLIKLIVRRLRV